MLRKTSRIWCGQAAKNIKFSVHLLYARKSTGNDCIKTVSDVAPPAGTDPNYMYPQGTILTCMACGRYFVRHSSRQRYCSNPDCQAERNNRKARAYYKRKKAAEEK